MFWIHIIIMCVWLFRCNICVCVCVLHYKLIKTIPNWIIILFLMIKIIVSRSHSRAYHHCTVTTNLVSVISLMKTYNSSQLVSFHKGTSATVFNSQWLYFFLLFVTLHESEMVIWNVMKWNKRTHHTHVFYSNCFFFCFENHV